jgi:hypothetical protein
MLVVFAQDIKMAFNFESTLNNVIGELKAGAKKWVLILFGIVVVFSYPIYFLTIQVTKFWFYNVPFNPQKYVNKQFVNSKSIGLANIEVVRSSYVDLVDGKRLIYTFLDNHNNKNIGFDPYVFKKQLLNASNQTVEESFDKVYLLPGQTQYIFAYTENLDAVSIAVQKQDDSVQVDYNPESSEFLKMPEFDIRQNMVEDSPVEGEQNLLRLRASVKNTTKFRYKKVDFIMLVRDTLDTVIGVQNYSFNEFLPDEEREIRLTYPKAIDKTAKSLDLRYSVNFLDPSNIKLQ